MRERFDVAIVGLGSAGSAAAFHLAQRGLRTIGLDRAAPPHTLGSHGGLTRLIRLLYAEHPGYVPLLRRAYELWRDLERRSGQTILHITGGVYFGPESAPFITGTLKAASEHRLPHELITGPALASRFALFTPPRHAAAVVDPAAGFLFPHRAIAAHLDLARAHGADLRFNQTVTGWHADDRGTAVHTPEGDILADRLILAGGAWMPQLLADLRIPLTVTRQTLCWVDPPDHAPFTLGRFPVWGVTLDGSSLFYGFPITPDGAGGRGLKLAHHSLGSATDPDTDPRTTEPGDATTCLQFLRNHLPAAAGPVIDQQVCLYTSTPDEHFVLGAHPAHANVIIASPCSGHGFKFAPVIGEVLADLAQQGHTRHDVGFLSPRRFGS